MNLLKKQMSVPEKADEDIVEIPVVEINHEPEKVSDVFENVTSDTQAVVPEFTTVFAVATFENCPDGQLSQDYVDSLMRYLRSEPHLEQNVASAELHHLSTRSFRNSVFVHTIDVKIQVRTARLWEGPATYVRKFLGLSNLWERSNGTIIKLSRIHQK